MTEQKKNLKTYILPAMLSNASFFLLGIVDGIFVGNGVGTDALGASNIAWPYAMVVGAISALFSIGGVAVAAVRIGRGDTEGANQAFMHAISAVIGVFSVLTVVGVCFTDQISRLLGANDTYLNMVSDYIFWYSVFVIPSGLYTCLASFIRNDGDPGLCSKAAVFCTVTNIIGDWIMVFPLKKGLAGTAFATGVATLLTVILLSTHFFRKRGQLRIKKFKAMPSLYKKLILRGMPEMVSQFAGPVTTFSMNRMLLTHLGDAAVNAFSIIGYAGSLFGSLSWGISSGLQPLFGQSYGAKDDKSLRFYLRSGMTMSIVGGGIALVITLFIGGPLCTLFGANEAAKAVVVTALPQYSLNYVFAANSAVLAAYLFSTKRTQNALTLNFCRSLIFNFLCINFLPLIFGSHVIWLSMSVAEGICLLIGIVLWRRSERNGIVYI